MRIAYVSAGAADMYCGSCLHDNALARALIGLGHDVTLVPTYTPIRTDETAVSIDQVFYGAIGVFLEQRSALFRYVPRVFDRWLASPRLLGWVARRGGATDARTLGALTLSVLSGEEGRQRRELERLVAWLRDELRPEIVHLTNSLFLGLARPLRRELGVPVLCSVQGEDLFLGQLPEPYRAQVSRLLVQKAGDANGFIAPSRYYAEHMAGLLAVPRERIHAVSLGISLEGFGDGATASAAEPFVVGYLARICPAKGLHVLAEAFRRLAERQGRDRVRLRIAGYLERKDRGYFEEVLRNLRAWGLDGSVEALGEVDRQQKIAFLRGLHVLSVPTTYREPKGRFVLEALAAGTPVVLPRHGAFPELIEATGGGLLVEPEDPAALAGALGELMEDVPRRAELGRLGREAVHRGYNDRVMAEATLDVYRRYC